MRAYIYLLVMSVVFASLPTVFAADGNHQSWFTKNIVKPYKVWQQKRTIKKQEQEYFKKKHEAEEHQRQEFNRDFYTWWSQLAKSLKQEQQEIEKEKYWAASDEYIYNQPATFLERAILVPWRERQIFKSLYPQGTQLTVPNTVTEFTVQDDLPWPIQSKKFTFSGKRAQYFGDKIVHYPEHTRKRIKGEYYPGIEGASFFHERYDYLPYWRTEVRAIPRTQEIEVRTLPSLSRDKQEPKKQDLREKIDTSDYLYQYRELNKRGINNLYYYLKEMHKNQLSIE